MISLRERVLSAHTVSCSSLRTPSRLTTSMVTPSTEPRDPETELVQPSKPAQRLGAALLNAIESVVAMMSFLVCISIIEKDVRTMIIVGAAELIFRACSRATIKLVSLYSQYDVEEAKIQRVDRKGATRAEERTARENLPRPWQAVGTFMLSSAIGSLVPLLGAAFIKDRQLRRLEVMVVSSIALVSLGTLSAKLNNLPLVKSVSRVLLGGYFAIGVAYCTTKLIG